MTEFVELTLAEIMVALRQGKITSCELTQAYLERIQRLEPWLHAFLYQAGEQALEKAEAADQRLADWRRDPTNQLPGLHGIPLAIKDVLCVQDMPCTCGSRILEGFIPAYHATSVERLLAAGAIVIGKTNTDEFAMGSSTEHSAYGLTHNPWDLDRVPGGSSGGSAAAVAACLAPAALGTDTGGSVRHPAAFCGVTAIKPTYGRVSRYGLVAFGSSLDVVGAFGKTVEDTAIVFEQMAGRDDRDATSMPVAVPKIDLSNLGDRPLQGMRVGIPEEYFITGIQAEVEASVRQAIASLESLGADLLPIHLPHTQYALPVYYLIAPAEASANLARYDGIRYGARVPAESMWQVFRQTRGKKFGPEVKRRIMLGTYALSAGYYDAYYGQAQKVRTLIRRDFELAFQQVDLIAAPVTPTTAFRIGEHTNDPLAMYLEDIFTLPANLAGIPGLAFPVGFDRQGLPIGMQLMASHFDEQRLFIAGHAYQQITGWHRARPDLSKYL
jgi:aspartyl-tRNA(Asn)/glutamyl-tRNA(Gln) amidotransferase subunit A